MALAPDDEIKGQCFSGTAIVEGDKHTLIYTLHNDDKEEQAVAIGDGTEYKCISNEAAIKTEDLPEGFSGVDFRDPKMWKEDGIYYCIASAKNDEGLGTILLFESKDLLEDKIRECITTKPKAHAFEDLSKVSELKDMVEIGG